MSPSRVLRAGMAAVAGAAVVNATAYSYQITDTFAGTSLTDAFAYNTKPDPTSGFVQYVGEDKGFVTVTDNVVRIDVDTTTVSAANGREAVRLESTKKYNHGLFITDFAHLPEQQCGLWPAFWTSNLDKVFPTGGEIDIVENINLATGSVETLHASSPFAVHGNSTYMTGALNYQSCDSDYSGGQGCRGYNVDTTTSYGKGFNDALGGVYAMEWTSEAIKIWSWTRANIPADITAGTPNPDSWGLPTFSTEGGVGAIDDYFMDHHIIINTDFCGGWASQDIIWNDGTDSSCASITKVDNCIDYVRQHGDVFKDSYWEFNSIKVYDYKVTPVSSTSSSSSSTSTTSTSSSTSSTSTSTTTTSSTSSTSTTSTSTTSTTSESATLTSAAASTSTTSTPSSAPTTSAQTSQTSAAASSTSATDSSSAASSPGSVAVPSSAAASSSSTTTTVFTTSTARSTDVQTISGTVTTVIVDLYTTICPVTATETSTSAGVSTTSFTTSTVQATSTLTGASGQLTTVIVDLYTTICPVTATETSTSAGVSTTSFTTSTVQATSTLTGSSGQLTTVIVDLYTTVCPVEEAATSTSAGLSTFVPASTTSTVRATSTYTSAGQVVTEIVDIYTTVCPVAEAESATTTKFLTATTYTTVGYPIATTSICPNCTTSTFYQTSTSTQYRTIAYVTPSASPINYANSTTSPIVKVITQSVIPVKASNATSTYSAVATGGVTKILTSTTQGAVVTPSSTPTVFTGNANRVGGGSVLALVMLGAAALFL